LISIPETWLFIKIGFSILIRLLPVKSNRKSFYIDRKNIYFIKFIFEAYDGMAQITTIDPLAAKVELYIAPGCQPDVDRLLDALKRDVLIRANDA